MEPLGILLSTSKPCFNSEGPYIRGYEGVSFRFRAVGIGLQPY